MDQSIEQIGIVSEIFECVDGVHQCAHALANALRNKTITQEQLRKIFEEIANDSEGEIYEGGYSGRGMYGKRCWGIKGSSVAILMHAGRYGLPLAELDNLGRDSIVYWSRITYTDAE